MKSVIQIVVFQIGLEHFGMEINRIRKIIRKTEMTEISDVHSRDTIGMMKMVDGMVPIISAHEKLHIEPLQGNTYFMVIVANEKIVAMPIDKVGNYYNVPVQCLHSVPALVRNTNEQYFHQIADLDGKLVPILNPELLFNEGDK